MKILTKRGTSDHERLVFAVRRCLSREPQDKELQVLQGFLDQQRERFGSAGANPWALITDEDQPQKMPAELAEDVTPADLAAWTALARVVLNLDETITKE